MIRAHSPPTSQVTPSIPDRVCALLSSITIPGACRFANLVPWWFSRCRLEEQGLISVVELFRETIRERKGLRGRGREVGRGGEGKSVPYVALEEKGLLNERCVG